MAIYEYRDAFSSGPEDMGQTDLVTHTIDKNRMWKKLKFRKCWTEASLSHARAAELALLFWLRRKMALPDSV